MHQDQTDRWSALDEDGRSEYTDMGPGALPSGEIEHRAALSLLLKGAGPRPARAFLLGWRLPAGMFPEGWRYPAGHLLTAWVAQTGPVQRSKGRGQISLLNRSFTYVAKPLL